MRDKLIQSGLKTAPQIELFTRSHMRLAESLKTHRQGKAADVSAEKEQNNYVWLSRSGLCKPMESLQSCRLGLANICDHVAGSKVACQQQNMRLHPLKRASVWSAPCVFCSRLPISTHEEVLQDHLLLLALAAALRCGCCSFDHVVLYVGHWRAWQFCSRWP